jgi:hypothetical protein
VLASERIFHKQSKKTRKYQGNTKSEKKTNGTIKEDSQLMKLSQPIIYDPNKPKSLSDNKQSKREIDNSQIAEITTSYLELHKNIINTYNSIYSQLINNNSELSLNIFITDSERDSNYPFIIKKIYFKLIDNGDKSLKLIDSIVTENLDYFIKSIELTQRFYSNLILNYINYIKK